MRGALKRIPGLLLPFIGLYFLSGFIVIACIGCFVVLSILLTFLLPEGVEWIIIPVIMIGYLVTLFGVLPKLSLSPVLLIQGTTGVIGSIRTSFNRTRGYWGKIVGNIFVAYLVLIVITFAWMFMLGILSVIVGPFIAGGADGSGSMALAVVGGFVWMILYLLMAFYSNAFLFVFHAKLSKTIMAHPRT